ncbi:unnamed protein product [Paramecium sonneborni]|uniref:Uncharacterized protein n=1 Tax=Paramecium sonneborni TaxID=65129 RepID=A0A8S1RSD3_9CILI|nr:unnamed protein product [Paramecium sonneborni]
MNKKYIKFKSKEKNQQGASIDRIRKRKDTGLKYNNQFRNTNSNRRLNLQDSAQKRKHNYGYPNRWEAAYLFSMDDQMIRYAIMANKYKNKYNNLVMIYGTYWTNMIIKKQTYQRSKISLMRARIVSFDQIMTQIQGGFERKAMSFF